MADKFLLMVLLEAANIHLVLMLNDENEVYGYDSKTDKFLTKQELFKIAITMTRNIQGHPDCFYSLRNAIVNRAKALNII